jgi:tetratricopeptide (TPR) repeat protein
MLWAMHPLHTEVVAYVATRTESMVALCYLVTLCGAVRRIEAQPARLWLVIAAAACLVGATAKESIVTAPLMVLLYDRVFGAGSWREALRRRGWFHAALLGPGFCWRRCTGTPRGRGAPGGPRGLSSWDYLLTQAPIVADYLRLAVWPYVLAIVLLLAATLWLWRRHPPLAFLATRFWVTLAPSSSVVPIVTELGGSRRMYPPLMPLVVLSVLAARWCALRFVPAPARPIGAVAVAAAATVALAIVSAARGLEYQDPVGIWETVLAARPHGRAHHNLGIALALTSLGARLAGEGRVADAADAFARSAAVASAAPGAHLNYGTALMQLGRATDVEAAFRRGLSVVPDHAPLRNASAAALATRGATDEAAAEFGRVLAANPANADALAVGACSTGCDGRPFVSDGSCLGAAREQRVAVDEADWRSERIEGVEHPFTPRHQLDRSHIVGAGAVEPARHGFEVVDGEIDVLARMVAPPRADVVAVGGRVVTRQDGAAAVEVVAARRDALARGVEYRRPERRRAADVGDREDDAIQACVGHRRPRRKVSRAATLSLLHTGLTTFVGRSISLGWPARRARCEYWEWVP